MIAVKLRVLPSRRATLIKLAAQLGPVRTVDGADGVVTWACVDVVGAWAGSDDVVAGERPDRVSPGRTCGRAVLRCGHYEGQSRNAGPPDEGGS
jgi:hypothetical protein